MRRKKTPQSTITVEQKPSPKAEPLEPPPHPSASGLSTGYGDLDDLLVGGLPKGYAVLLLSPRCDERDLLLRKIIGSTLSAGVPTFYLSNDPSKIQDMASTYREDFYALSPQAAKILSPPANLYKIPSIDSLSDLSTTFTKILEMRAKQGTGDRLLVLDLLTYSHIFLVHKEVAAGKWFSGFLARRKAEGFTVLAFLNPVVVSNAESQTLIDVFDGVIEIYEKELRGSPKRYLVVKKMYEHKYSDSELMLDKDKLL
jgi:KaiC/GvpD/RAD55 family RecA-like ATPase